MRVAVRLSERHAIDRAEMLLDKRGKRRLGALARIAAEQFGIIDRIHAPL
jgi:hypothetical protein